MPAIAGEGRALYDAAAAQGIAGVMARQRSSPYLPGVRSRLWRFIPCSASAATIAAADTLDEDSTATAAAPVVALIRRLPLLFEE